MAVNVKDLLTERLRDQDTRGVNAELLAAEILGIFASRDIQLVDGDYLRELQRTAPRHVRGSGG